MTPDEMLHFITWHFEVGSAIDTRVQLLGSGKLEWEGRLVGPRFDVLARISVRLKGREALGVAHMEVATGSQIFDLVLGARLLCPPGRLARPSLPDEEHSGTGAYRVLPQGECSIYCGEYGNHYNARCIMEAMPNGFAWVPYIADEPDGWRLHARIRSARGQGYRRFWIFGREVLRHPIPHGEQDVLTESNAHSPLYRFFRAADYREQTATIPMVYDVSVRVMLPDGIVP